VSLYAWAERRRGASMLGGKPNVLITLPGGPMARLTTRRWDSSGGRRLTLTRKQMLNSVAPDAANGIVTKESTAL
jgi:hypothetical protein